ncbi:MAG: hypothetical protein M3680_26860 [Myxococcota bacterium]|nr:hypothetical protein [Myxococcota bacterium]
MRLSSLLVIAVLGCSGGTRAPTQPSGATTVAAYAATRWLPARPSYVVAARTVRDAQQGLRDLVDAAGLVAGFDAAEVSAELRALILVDPLSTSEVANLGVDLDGGFAMFSEGINPTFVVHLSSPPQFAAFMEQQTHLKTQSVVEDGVEVFTSPLPGNVRISWAVADAWLWVHLALPNVPDDGTTWFAASRRPGAPTWQADWQWAQGQGQPGLVGFVQLRSFLQQLTARAPHSRIKRELQGPDAAACVRLLDPVARASLVFDGSPQEVSARLAFDLGPAAAAISRASLPVPEGWAAATAQVPLAAQWNLDLAAVRTVIDPCARALDVDLARAEQLGVRAGRAFLRTFDPDERSGSGAVALDLAHKRFFASQLDNIPLRSALERKRQFGPHAGRSLAIPMFLTIDYVLTDALALAAVGDGLLTAIVGTGGGAPGPVFAVDVQPLGLTAEAWTGLFELAGIRSPKRVAERLLRWRAARLALTVDGSRLVLTAAGTRR